MGYIVIVEATEYVNDGIGFPNIGQELVSQSFTFAGTFHKSGDIYDFYCCGDDAVGVYQLSQFI